MNFKEMYFNCREQLTEKIKELWLDDKELWNTREQRLGITGEFTLKSPEYMRQIEGFTPMNGFPRVDGLLGQCLRGDNIVVEDMGEWESANGLPASIPARYWQEWPSSQRDNASMANATIPLVQKNYNPYTHQAECWDKLLTENKSICVTSGTGSGKTECFMLPLVRDLEVNHPANRNAVQAIFLYPLNALMEDQRIRMSECIECSGDNSIKFAVYNGNTPNDIDDAHRDATTVLADRRKHELVFRDEIRQTHPNIIFTNPTMLEYLLLRGDDQNILRDSQGELRWIVIDETHTFSGAGAAELALLIRRVLDAFGTDITHVRFATSSATVGAGNTGKLLDFIAGITGKNQQDISIIPGNRSLQQIAGADCQLLHANTYLPLNDILPNQWRNRSTEDKLEELDRLCNLGLKVKVHFFAKALNNGLYVEIAPTTNRYWFELMTYIPIDHTTGHHKELILDACYCTQCGTVFGSGTWGEDNKLIRHTNESISIFEDYDDDDSDDDSTSGTNAASSNGSKGGEELLITYYKSSATNPNAKRYNVDYYNKKMISDPNGLYMVVENPDRCPICGGLMKDHVIRPFNVAADKVARLLAPKLIEQAQPLNPLPTPPDVVMEDGKQMISFADSRAKAAKPSLKHNKEMEEKLVEWVIYKELMNRAQNNATMIQQVRNMLQVAQQNLQQLNNQFNRTQVATLQTQLNGLTHNHITWVEALRLLQQDGYFEFFSRQFAHTEDLGSVNYPYRYALVALYSVFNRRYKKKHNAETDGTLRVVYPAIEDLRQQPNVLPQAVVNFNAQCPQPLTVDDWCDLLTLYVDYKVRTNQSLFFNRQDQNYAAICIQSVRNMRTINGSRRSAQKSKNNTRFRELLSLVLDNKQYNTLNQNQRQLVDDVVDECWNTIRNRINILEQSQSCDENGNWGIDPWLDPNNPQDEGYMNLTQMAFTLPDRVWKCPVTNRNVTTVLGNYSPYRGMNGYGEVVTQVQPLPVMNKPQLFLQSEHTAQLGRKQVKSRTQDFKDHKINVLACSTTMEMGVDLGSVELVEMTNIPPHPANYKQRAGRAGRRGQNRSACVTICGSNGVDARFFNDSLANVTKTINPPTVDLHSRQVVQRHINSYLFRQWLGTHTYDDVMELFTSYEWEPDARGRVMRKDHARLLQNGMYIRVTPNGSGGTIPYDPNDNINAPWSNFVTYLDGLISSPNPIINQGLTRLIDGTIYTTADIKNCIRNTRDAFCKVQNEINLYCLALKNNTTRSDVALNYSFTSLLEEDILSYLATHQFLPNANMPINVVEFKLNDSDNRSNNPNYDLATALGQWAPGNYITVKDITYRSGGIRWDSNRSFGEVRKCSVCGHTWLDSQATCPICGQPAQQWRVNGSDKLELIEPIAFVPNEDTSRITENNQQYTRAQAELIGASKMYAPARGCFAHRVSESANSTSRILLYNDGIGYGYRICKHCGKAQVEASPATPTDTPDIILSMFPKVDNNHPNIFWHKDIKGRDTSCSFDVSRHRLEDHVLRNMIIGVPIQTDYCEIQFYREENNRMVAFKLPDDKDIMTTLGVLICSFLIEQDICERKDIDFIVIGDGRLCIYDTAKGGAGYAKQLNQQLIEDALDYARQMLTNCNSIYQILDSYSQRYSEHIDILNTKQWLDDENQHRHAIPRNIFTAFPTATLASFVEIEQLI